jgi:hypothetical protein
MYFTKYIFLCKLFLIKFQLTAFSLWSQNVCIFRCCFIHLKISSIPRRFRYNAATVTEDDLKLLVRKTDVFPASTSKYLIPLKLYQQLLGKIWECFGKSWIWFNLMRNSWSKIYQESMLYFAYILCWSSVPDLDGTMSQWTKLVHCGIYNCTVIEDMG